MTPRPDLPASVNRLSGMIRARFWKLRGSVPDSAGAGAARWFAIEQGVANARNGRYGFDDPGLDERVVEFPWIFDRMAALDHPGGRGGVLDAGSIMNHRPILRWWNNAGRSPLSIVTLAHEGAAHVSNTVRYEFADLRHLPYRDEWFSAVLCISTLEHVGLDNTAYGAAVAAGGADPGTASVQALRELRRVSAHGASLLLSVPFGARSNRGWFRIFDADDLRQVIDGSGWTHARSRFFRATKDGWRECGQDDVGDAGYNERARRGGLRTAPPFVAAAEAIALVEMTRG
ncbi:MAG: class I SAM-dependent methyltransferase [Gemmatimonadaceae bacterium]